MILTLVACGPTPTPQVIRETVEVTREVEVTRLVEQTILVEKPVLVTVVHEKVVLVDKPVTVLITSTPFPTYTPYPTYTPQPLEPKVVDIAPGPSPTIKATETSESVVTPTLELSPSERAQAIRYAEEIISIGDEAQTWFRDILLLAETARGATICSERWFQLASDGRDLARKWGKITPPNTLKEAHLQVQLGLEGTADALQDFWLACSFQNRQGIKDATEKMEAGADLCKRGLNSITQWVVDHLGQ